MNSVLLVNFCAMAVRNGSWRPRSWPTKNLGTEETSRKGEDIKPAKCLGTFFHQMMVYWWFFRENFPNCDVLVSSLSSLNPVKSSETHEEAPASQTEALVLLELLGCRKWKAILGENRGNKPPILGWRSCCGSGSLGLERAKRWLACLLSFVGSWSCSCERTGCRFLEAMLACFLFIFSSGLFVVGSLRVAFFGAHPLGQQDLVGSPLFPAAPLAGCRRQVKLTPCPWGQPIGFCERKTNPMDDSKTNGLMCLLGTTATKPCFQLLYWRESHIWRCQARSSPERGGPLDFFTLESFNSAVDTKPRLPSWRPCGWYKEPL